MRFLAILAALVPLAVGCGGRADEGAPAEAAPAVVPLAAPFELAMGDAAEVGPEALRLELRALAEESRCPAGAQCATAGNAAVELGVEASGGGTATITLNTDRPPREVGAFGHVVRLESVAPEPPPLGEVADTAAYRATLHVTREGP
jgi:hypothetical protein